MKDPIEESLESTGMNAPRLIIIALCFFIFLVDAFDVVAMSVAAPAIGREWGLEHSEMGFVFTAALIGMMLGALMLAPLADRHGRRKLLLSALFTLSVSVFLVPHVSTITQMVFVRFLTGLAIGSILASATTVAAEFSPSKIRAAAVSITALGYSVGAAIVGPISNVLLEHYDWRMIFNVGGGLSAFVFFLTAVALPESIHFLKSSADRDPQALRKINSVLRKIQCPIVDALPQNKIFMAPQLVGSPLALFRVEHRNRSVLLWLCFFMGLFITYFLLSWTPTLFIEAGFEREEGVQALTWYAFSGIFGAVTVAFALLRFSPTRTVAPLILVCGLLMLIFPFFENSPLSVLYVMFGLIGFFVSAALVGLYSIAADLYPASIRATGIGWGVGIGRLGAVVSPLLVGYLLTKGWTMYQLFGVFAVPFLLTGWSVLFLTKFDADAPGRTNISKNF